MIGERLTPPRENVLLVPDRNVLLTKTGWGGERTRSSPNDPAGQRPTGSAAESREEADRTGASRQGVGRHVTADPAIIAAAEKRRRQSGHAQAAWPAFQSQDRQIGPRRNSNDPGPV